jgi:L-iditol 2-dehydrogenase
MQALSLYDVAKMEPRTIADPTPGPRDVVLRVSSVGLCGTDFHIYEGHANYNTDATGRQIPFRELPQILGHEFGGTVIETGREVKDLKPGDRVLTDQGLNCASFGKDPYCEYCATGHTHQCQYYQEHGITGLQGALAEFIAVPAINCVRVESDMPDFQIAMGEPLGCVTHACETLQKTPARYMFGGERAIKNALICGAGPAGLLFTQYLRNVIGFDGLLLVTEPNARRRAIAESYGATAIDPTSVDLIKAVQEFTKGEKLNLLIESAGVARLFRQMPALLRKQASVVLYGHGHHGEDLGVLNLVQFIEATLIAPTGASGAIDTDGKPLTYRRALKMLSDKRIDVSHFITNQYHKLADVPHGFSTDRHQADYIKGIYAPQHNQTP